MDFRFSLSTIRFRHRKDFRKSTFISVVRDCAEPKNVKLGNNFFSTVLGLKMSRIYVFFFFLKRVSLKAGLALKNPPKKTHPKKPKKTRLKKPKKTHPQVGFLGFF
jgi:hypothetical protein